MCRAISFRFAATGMAFTRVFTRFQRYIEWNTTTTQGETEKNEDLNTGKNLVNLAHGCLWYLIYDPFDLFSNQEDYVKNCQSKMLAD